MAQKSYFFFKLPFNFQLNFFTALFVTSLRSRFGRRCRMFNAVFLIGIVWSWQGDPWANAGCCPWQKRDFHQRSAPSLSLRRTLIWLLCLLCFHSTCPTSPMTSVCRRDGLSRHTCNSPRIMPRYPKLTYFRKFSTSDLLWSTCVKLYVRVVIPKSGPSCVQSIIWRFFFLTLDGFSIIFSRQNSQF